VRFAHPHTVTVLRSGGWDRYGNPLPEQEHDLPGCAIAPGSSEDLTSTGGDAAGGGAGAIQVTTVDWLIFAPPRADVRGEDRIRLPEPWGGVWQVDGIPDVYRNPFTDSGPAGGEPGVRIRLTGRA